jgi:hypothetical protein
MLRWIFTLRWMFTLQRMFTLGNQSRLIYLLTFCKPQVNQVYILGNIYEPDGICIPSSTYIPSNMCKLRSIYIPNGAYTPNGVCKLGGMCTPGSAYTPGNAYTPNDVYKLLTTGYRWEVPKEAPGFTFLFHSLPEWFATQ